MAARTFNLTAAFVAESCINCGILFGIPGDFHAVLQRSGRSFYCPNGHSMTYGQSEEDRLREKLRAAQTAAGWGSRMADTKLDEAVAAILASQPDRDPWTRLVVATVHLAHALAAWDQARAEYVAAHPPPPGGWPRRPARRTTEAEAARG